MPTRVTPVMDKTVTGISIGVSSGTAGAGLLTLNSIALIIGIIGTLLGVWMAYVFHQRRERRELEQHEWERNRHNMMMQLMDAGVLPPSQVVGDPEHPIAHRGGAEPR